MYSKPLFRNVFLTAGAIVRLVKNTLRCGERIVAVAAAATSAVLSVASSSTCLAAPSDEEPTEDASSCPVRHARLAARGNDVRDEADGRGRLVGDAPDGAVAVVAAAAPTVEFFFFGACSSSSVGTPRASKSASCSSVYLR